MRSVLAHADEIVFDQIVYFVYLHMTHKKKGSR